MATTMTGSEKQIAWAEKIRTKLLGEIAEQRAIFEALGRRKGASDELIASELAKFDAVVSKIEAQTEARYWIDNRNEIGVTMLRKSAR